MGKNAGRVSQGDDVEGRGTVGSGTAACGERTMQECELLIPPSVELPPHEEDSP